MIVATFCVKFLIIAISIFLDSKISKISVVVCFVFAKRSFCKTHYLVFRVFTIRVPKSKITVHVRDLHLSKANKLRN